MKNKLIAAVLAAALLLTGCGSSTPEKGKYEFYYLQENYLHSADRSVLAIERRTVEGDLKTIVSEYLQGPKNEGNVSPFPEGTQLQSLMLEGGCLKLDLGNDFSSLTGMELTIACSALANTCFSLCQAQEIQIFAGDNLLDGRSSITMTPSSMLLTDDSADDKEAT